MTSRPRADDERGELGSSVAAGTGRGDHERLAERFVKVGGTST
jgi:hypothetical protein